MDHEESMACCRSQTGKACSDNCGCGTASPEGEPSEEKEEQPELSSVLTESLGSVQLRNQMQSDPWHRAKNQEPGRVSGDLWVVVKGVPIVQPSKEGQEDSGAQDDLENQPSPSGEAYVAIDHEDVVDAVAEFVKGRIETQLGSRSFDPSEVTTAVSLAFSDEKEARWKRIWGNGRLLYRSASAAGGLAKDCREELGPQGRTGQALRTASSKALSVLRLSAASDTGHTSTA